MSRAYFSGARSITTRGGVLDFMEEQLHLAGVTAGSKEELEALAECVLVVLRSRGCGWRLVAKAFPALAKNERLAVIDEAMERLHFCGFKEGA